MGFGRGKGFTLKAIYKGLAGILARAIGANVSRSPSIDTPTFTKAIT